MLRVFHAITANRDTNHSLAPALAAAGKHDIIVTKESYVFVKESMFNTISHQGYQTPLELVGVIAIDNHPGTSSYVRCGLQADQHMIRDKDPVWITVNQTTAMSICRRPLQRITLDDLLQKPIGPILLFFFG